MKLITNSVNKENTMQLMMRNTQGFQFHPRICLFFNKRKKQAIKVIHICEVHTTLITSSLSKNQ